MSINHPMMIISPDRVSVQAEWRLTVKLCRLGTLRYSRELWGGAVIESDIVTADSQRSSTRVDFKW